MTRNFIFLVMGCLAVSTLAPAEADEHKHHHHEASSSKQGYTRLMAKYALPDVKLMRTDGTQGRSPSHASVEFPLATNVILLNPTR